MISHDTQYRTPTRTGGGAASLLVSLLLASPASTDPSAMWNCSVGESRASAVVLVDNGGDSYVKISGQRVAARVSDGDDSTRRWSWDTNAIDVDGEGLARYYEAGDYATPKGKFRCRKIQ